MFTEYTDRLIPRQNNWISTKFGCFQFYFSRVKRNTWISRRCVDSYNIFSHCSPKNCYAVCRVLHSQKFPSIPFRCTIPDCTKYSNRIKIWFSRRNSLERSYSLGWVGAIFFYLPVALNSSRLNIKFSSTNKKVSAELELFLFLFWFFIKSSLNRAHRGWNEIFISHLATNDIRLHTHQEDEKKSKLF